jgi:hypothetical protein
MGVLRVLFCSLLFWFMNDFDKHLDLRVCQSVCLHLLSIFTLRQIYWGSKWRQNIRKSFAQSKKWHIFVVISNWVLISFYQKILMLVSVSSVLLWKVHLYHPDYLVAFLCGLFSFMHIIFSFIPEFPVTH